MAGLKSLHFVFYTQEFRSSSRHVWTHRVINLYIHMALT